MYNKDFCLRCLTGKSYWNKQTIYRVSQYWQNTLANIGKSETKRETTKVIGEAFFISFSVCEEKLTEQNWVHRHFPMWSPTKFLLVILILWYSVLSFIDVLFTRKICVNVHFWRSDMLFDQLHFLHFWKSQLNISINLTLARYSTPNKFKSFMCFRSVAGITNFFFSFFFLHQKYLVKFSLLLELLLLPVVFVLK